MKFSDEYAHYHTSTFYPKGCDTRKMSAKTFRKETCLAHLVGRAYACQKMIENHKKEPYKSIDEMLGDLELEMIHCLNEFRKGSGALMPKMSLENVNLFEIKEQK